MSENKLNQIKTLPDIVDENKNSIRRGPFGSSLKKSFFVESGFKVYQQGNAIRNDFEYGEYFIDKEKYKELNAFKVQPEDIIISCSGTIGKLAIAPKNIKPGIINQALLKITLDRKIISNEYFSYFFKNYVENGQLKTKGAAIKNIVSVKNLKKIPIPVPSLCEQHRIVSKLDALFAEIDASLALIDHNIVQAEALLGSYLDQKFNKAETENVLLEKLSDKIQYGYTGKSKEKGDYYYLRITDIQNGKVDYSTAPFSDISIDAVPKYLLKKGDILFARTGATAGKSYLFNDNESAVFASYLIRVDVKRDLLLPEYLKWFFQSDNYWAQIYGSIVGAAQPNFNGTKLKKLIIPVPEMETQYSLAEQFEEMNNEVEEIKARYVEKRENLEALKSSLLDQAFKGEL